MNANKMFLFYQRLESPTRFISHVLDTENYNGLFLQLLPSSQVFLDMFRDSITQRKQILLNMGFPVSTSASH